MHKTVFRCGEETGTLVVSYYPLVGTDRNTGPRYQEEARLTGFDIMGITRVGSDTTTKNPALRQALSPPYFDDFCACQAEGLQYDTANYDTVIFRGQSTGSFPVLGVVKSGLVRATHLVIEDGINLRQGTSGRSQGLFSAWYAWLSTQLKESINMSDTPSDWMKPVTAAEPHKLATFLTDVYHWSPLWRSSYSRNTLLRIALTQPKLPILCKFIGHSVTSTPELVPPFQQALYNSASRRRSENGRGIAEVRTDYDPEAWHGYHLYPQYGAAHLLEASAMKSYVD